jgi:hypothetical protein
MFIDFVLTSKTPHGKNQRPEKTLFFPGIKVWRARGLNLQQLIEKSLIVEDDFGPYLRSKYGF